MADQNHTGNTGQLHTESSIRGRKRLLLRVVLCVTIIAVGVIGFNYLTRTAPKAGRRPPARMAPLVQVQEVTPGTQTVKISVMGTVIPAREITLKSRVSGEVRQVHPDFMEGGFAAEGTKLLQIDDTDYQLALTKAQSTVINARYALKLEKGRQAVAQREWNLLNGDRPENAEDAELALRRPHLEKALADVKAAEADERQARLQLERTAVSAPFNAIITTTHVNIGSQVSPQEKLAELVGTNAWWIRVSVPVHQLKWIQVPMSHGETGARASIFYRSGARRTGSVIKLLGDLEPEGRMARLIIHVEDPLGLKTAENQAPPLFVGEYVRVEIEGRPISNAYLIPRTALRDNTFIWIADKGDHLDIRKVRTTWRDRDSVILTQGLKPGEKLIVSRLATPIKGMPLRLENRTKKIKPKESAP
jgi:RND family efflux transporter MFP subunit